LKSKRHAKIKELIQNSEVYTQVDLTRLLAEAGFNVTQATVSRDIHELRLTKVAGTDGGLKYSLSVRPDDKDMARLNRVFNDCFVSIDCAGNMLVIHTVSGMAMAVGAALDAMNFPEVLGSVAGDDVLMCVIRTESQAAALMEKLRR
jgi:transcriptional regulator of arginine metabolism